MPLIEYEFMFQACRRDCTVLLKNNVPVKSLSASTPVTEIKEIQCRIVTDISSLHGPRQTERGARGVRSRGGARYRLARDPSIREQASVVIDAYIVSYPLDVAASKYTSKYIGPLPMPLTKDRPFHTVPEARTTQTPTSLRTPWKRAAAHVQNSLRTYYYNTTRKVRNRRPLTGD